jgi:hypothetical protein
MSRPFLFPCRDNADLCSQSLQNYGNYELLSPKCPIFPTSACGYAGSLSAKFACSGCFSSSPGSKILPAAPGAIPAPTPKTLEIKRVGEGVRGSTCGSRPRSLPPPNGTAESLMNSFATSPGSRYGMSAEIGQINPPARSRIDAQETLRLLAGVQIP